MKGNFSMVKHIITRTPKQAIDFGRGFFNFEYAKMLEKTLGRFRDNRVDQLSLIYFRLTPLCNLRCVMCGQRGDTGVLKGDFALNEAKKILPVEYYKNLIDQIKSRKPTLYLWGGEPFLYPGLFELIEYSVKADIITSINTNGISLEKNAEWLVKSGLQSIMVSLDGFEETNDKIRGEGSYQRVMRGFEAIKREKAKQKSKLPHMGIVTTVSKLNYKDLYRLAEATQEFGLSWHIFNLGTYTNDEIIAEQKVFMKEKLDIEIDCLNGFNTGYNKDIDGQELYDILKKIHSMPTNHPKITVPALEPDKINIYYSELEKPVRTNCMVPWSQASIDYNGNVNFCADYNEYSIGNIKDTPFWELYNNDRAKKFRQTLKESPNGIFPGCVRCYQNMLFGKRVKGF